MVVAFRDEQPGSSRLCEHTLLACTNSRESVLWASTFQVSSPPAEARFWFEFRLRLGRDISYSTDQSHRAPAITCTTIHGSHYPEPWFA